MNNTSNGAANNQALPLSHFQKYVDIAKETKGEPVDSAILEKIKEKFKKANSDLNEQAVSSVITQVINKMKNNQALVQMTLDHKGEESRFFFPWLVSVWTSQSSALEPAYGFGFDCEGNFLLIPEEDPMFPFIDDPTFVFARMRSEKMAQLAVQEQMRAIVNKGKSLVIDICAGWMPWARYFVGCEPNPKYQCINAYDRDTAIPLDKLFNKPMPELGINYQIADMKESFADPKNQNANLIFMAGVLSYLSEEQIIGILVQMYQMLAPGGTFFCDIQLNCVYLQRSMAVFGWDTLNYLPNSLAEAVMMFEKIRTELIKHGVRYSVEYIPDTINEIPSVLMMKFTKN